LFRVEDAAEEVAQDEPDGWVYDGVGLNEVGQVAAESGSVVEDAELE